MEVLCWNWKTPDSPLANEEETSACGQQQLPFPTDQLIQDVPANKEENGSLKSLFSLIYNTASDKYLLLICMSNYAT